MKNIAGAIMHIAYRVKQLILLIGDLLSFSIGFFVALSVRNLAIPSTATIERHITLFAITFILWILINYINGLYDLSLQMQKGRYRRIAETSLFSLIISVVFFYLIPDKSIAPKTILVLTTFFGYCLAALWRLIHTYVIGDKRLQTTVLCIGYTPELQELIEICQRHPEKGYRIIALVDPDAEPNVQLSNSIHLSRDMKDVAVLTKQYAVQLVVTAPHLRQNTETLETLYSLLFTHIHITDLTTFYQMMTGRIPPATFSQGWFLDHLRTQEHPVYRRCKTAMDYVAAITIGIFFLATLPLFALIIKLTSKGPVFIRQQRVGKDGKLFTLYKYRSMYALSADGSAEPDGVQFATKGDTRITPIGKMLRLTRIDELPQVLNVFKGDMTLVGPRPERPEIVAELTKQMVYYPLRHIVKPGLTGWAMLHQDYTDTLEKSLQKLQYDLYYIKHHSLLLDLSILLKTINKIIRMKGQ